MLNSFIKDLGSINFLYKKSGKILPVKDKELNEMAKHKLKLIYKEYKNKLPRSFIKNWSKVKLYDPKGDIEKAHMLIIDEQKGAYDLRNNLNHLTGKEWTFFINSIEETNFKKDELKLFNYLRNAIIETKYSINGKESISHSLRKKHPSPKPPILMKRIIEFFTKEGDSVLDPFMGVGGTLLGASLCNRDSVGIDLCKEYINIYKECCKKENLKEGITINGDSRDIINFNEINNKKFDLILTDPPYANMLTKKRTGGDKTKKIGENTPFTKESRDIGNLNYQSFLKELRLIIEKSIKLLKNNGYVVIFTKDMQPTKKHHNLLHFDIINELRKIEELTYKGYKIWYDKTLNLFPYGYPYSFVVNQLHQFILIFRKEK